MSRWSLLALLLGLLLVAAPFTKLAAAAEEYDDEDDDDEGGGGAKDDEEKDVVVLTTKNFDSIVKKSKFALVEFYAPWCGHCKTLKPHYAKAATILKASSPDVVIAKVDATAENDLGTKFNVQGYPTLKWFVDGEIAGDYNGGRDADGIVSWVSKKTGPPAITVDSIEKLTDVESSNPVIFVGYFTAFEGDAYTAFKGVAAKTEGVVFVETTSADVGKAAGLTEPGVVAVKNFEGEPREVTPLSGDLDDESVKAFVQAEKMPLTIEFSQGNSDKIFNSGIKQQLILWASAADLKGDSEVSKAYREAAKKFKGKLVFVTTNNEGDGADPITNFFGLKGATGPVLLGFHMEKNKKFKLSEPLTAASVEAFAQGIIDGTQEAEYKSAPIPEEAADADGVVTVVGKSVEAVVLDASKDVLLEVYAPWCGHCKKLEPIYKKLAKRFKKVDSVVIAKMDGTENEHPDIEVKGFPTILFYPAGESKTPIVFEGGDRSLKALTKFIKTNAAVPYELPKKGESGEDEGTSDDKDKPKEAKDEL